MTEKQIIRKFIVGTFDCSEYFFESAWKHVESNYKRLVNIISWRKSLAVLYDNTRTGKQYDAIKSLSILYETIKEIERTGKAGQFLSLLEEISKKHKTEEELKLKILKNIDAANRQIQDFLCDKSKIAEDKRGKDETLELGLNGRGKPEVKINGRSITIKERFFVDMVYLAACKLKRKDGLVDVKRELRWTEEHVKHYPDGLRDVLEKGDFGRVIDRKNLIERHQDQAKIRLGVFKPDPKCIIIDENICSFDSGHRWTVAKGIDNILEKIASWEESGQKIDFEKDDEKTKELLLDLQSIEKQELKPVLRHVFVMASAIKIVGWKFQDDNWRKEWRKFLKKCNKIHESAGYDREIREEMGLYLSF